MLLIIDIILTIFAWRKGWRWIALLPIGISLIAGFLVGLSVVLTGGSIESAKSIGFVLDMIAIIVLIILNVKSPKFTEANKIIEPHKTDLIN